MPEKGSILVIDDEPEICESLAQLLRMEGYRADTAPDAESGLKKFGQNPFDLVLLDVSLPEREQGVEVLRSIKRDNPETPVIMITAYDSSETAFTVSKEGADNYITKPWDNEKLLLDVRNALSNCRLRAENLQWRRLQSRYDLPNVIGKSERMKKVFDLIMQIAPSRATVLIQGESGTGKELIAKTIHLRSSRAQKPMVPVNTGSMPIDLLESTLFGHVKGAFTSAIASKKGLFELADQSSIFFDEIGTIGIDTQAKLLRVIQEREFMRLGGTETVRVDVRILAATNSDLGKMVEEGKFREDLYYRLNVIAIDLPPLRDRKEDIPLLARHFFTKYGEENQKSGLAFSPEVMKLLMNYGWPGNIRELENLVERSVVLASGSTIGLDLLPDSLREGNGLSAASRNQFSAQLNGDSLSGMLQDYERRIIVKTLERAGGRQTEAAEQLKVPLSTLNQKIKRLHIRLHRRGDG
ncbi:MAG: sigma-54 dependent transcriptional regulator [Acidobacteria bacterium]|nr:sigma-54 dependent transcriptional regulator [Acidobacteriota bacterium]